MRVFVMNMRGKPLMPTTPRKARILLKEGKASVWCKKPFTIQLKYATGETVQPIELGIDTGSKNIGIAITSEEKVIDKGEIVLRQDIKENLDTRRTYRRGRRNRKTRYRKARFLNRTRPEGWLPPSLQSRVDNTFMWIDRYMAVLPNPTLHIEVGKFDTAKMINPEIKGIDYQYGQTYGYYDVRYYVFARDDYTCQVCKKKNKILHTHHIVYKSEGGTDRADNLITVCSECHTAENHKPGGVLYGWMKKGKKVKQYKEPPFMNTLRRRIFERYPNADITYGSATSPARKELGLEKTHYNDAIAISGIKEIKKNPDDYFLIRQVRHKKRSLHEANARKGRKEPNQDQKRNVKNVKARFGFTLHDTVKVYGQKGWVSSFSSTGIRVKNRDDDYIRVPGKKHSLLPVGAVRKKGHNTNWLLMSFPCSSCTSNELAKSAPDIV